MKFRLIRDKKRNGFLNMAVDDYFFEKVEKGEIDYCVIRTFKWEPLALSLGYHQKYEKAVNEDFVREMGIDVVRRPTGGKAVLHHKEITYSVVGSLKRGFFKDNSLEETYYKIGLALKRGLELLGLKPELEKKREIKLDVLNPSPCFLIPTSREILIEGKKVIGSAQKRGFNGFLQHGSIPYQIDYRMLALSTRNSEKEIPLFEKSFAALSAFIPSIDEEQLEDAICKGFKEEFKGEFEDLPLNSDELYIIEKIAKEKYSTDSWNKRKEFSNKEV